MEKVIQKKDIKRFEKDIENMFKHAIDVSNTHIINDIDKKKRVIEGAIKILLTKYVNKARKKFLKTEKADLNDELLEKTKLELFELFEAKKEKLYKKYKKYFIV